MAEIYPPTYPCPTWEYGQTITTYPARTAMECGWNRQRKIWPSTGSSVNLTFEMDTAMYATWSAWVYEFGYDWFTIELDKFNGVNKPVDIRFGEAVQFFYDDYNNIIARVIGEIFDA